MSESVQKPMVFGADTGDFFPGYAFTWGFHSDDGWFMFSNEQQQLLTEFFIAGAPNVTLRVEHGAAKTLALSSLNYRTLMVYFRGKHAYYYSQITPTVPNGLRRVAVVFNESNDNYPQQKAFLDAYGDRSAAQVLSVLRAAYLSEVGSVFPSNEDDLPLTKSQVTRSNQSASSRRQLSSSMDGFGVIL